MRKIIILVFILVTALIILFSCQNRYPTEHSRFWVVILEKHQQLNHPSAFYEACFIYSVGDQIYAESTTFWFTDSADKYEVGDTLNIRK